ncbi:MAG TPA: hypothetical protein VKS21_06115, partial [Spirochaetota bacterium]|nr:hypothetical protein [Spirochaetota bacterium]
DSTLIRLSNNSPHYRVEQISIVWSLTGEVVFNLSRKFNISLGGGPSFAVVNQRQVYENLPVLENNGIVFSRREINYRRPAIGAKGSLTMEYFVLPRFAFSLGLSYLHIYVFKISDHNCEVNGSEYHFEEGNDHRDSINDAFGLDPFLGPLGRSLINDPYMSHHLKLFIGLRIYL